MPDIKENVRAVRETIAEAADRSGRRASDITLVGVTKTADIGPMREMIGCGVADVGENRPQEIVRKYPEFIQTPLNWHMIGNLQKNKIKYILDKVCLIHSVDSIGLAAEIDRLSIKINKITDILIEINIAGEETKSGADPDKCIDLVQSCSDLTHVKVRGLMTMAPYIDETDKLRLYFKRMNELFIDIRKKCGNNGIIDTLSMGMTNDYAIAIEEGATMVRVGTAIFGAHK